MELARTVLDLVASCPINHEHPEGVDESHSLPSVALAWQRADWRSTASVETEVATMTVTAAMQAQMKVAEGAEKLAETETIIDLTAPQDDRRLTFDEAVRLVQERYAEAITLLGKL